MTKTLPERFAELIELLILAIEAQFGGGWLPNRLADPVLLRVRASLERLSAELSAAFARVAAAAAAAAANPVIAHHEPAPIRIPRNTPPPVDPRAIPAAARRRRRAVRPAAAPAILPESLPPRLATPAEAGHDRPAPAGDPGRRARAGVALPSVGTVRARPPNRKSRPVARTLPCADFITI